MGKPALKFLFKIEMPDTEFLTAYKALDLAAGYESMIAAGLTKKQIWNASKKLGVIIQKNSM
jgi:hypothetical protein